MAEAHVVPEKACSVRKIDSGMRVDVKAIDVNIRIVVERDRIQRIMVSENGNFSNAKVYRIGGQNELVLTHGYANS